MNCDEAQYIFMIEMPQIGIINSKKTNTFPYG